MSLRQLLIIASTVIFVAAVADELILVQPSAECDVNSTAVTPSGTGLDLFGDALFKRAMARRFPLSHLIGLLLLSPDARPDHAAGARRRHRLANPCTQTEASIMTPGRPGGRSGMLGFAGGS